MNHHAIETHVVDTEVVSLCDRKADVGGSNAGIFVRLAEDPPQDSEVLWKLAQAMSDSGSNRQKQDSSIPSGYTYLGQFIAHDVSFNTSRNLPAGATPGVTISQGRSPCLDLDSLYGAGPPCASSEKFYEEDGVHLRVGSTAPRPTDRSERRRLIGYDLPRRGPSNGASPAEQRAAVIPDDRNDTNLAVAQIHLSFIRFHNFVVDDLRRRKSGLSDSALLEEARSEVIRHYQCLVWTDFLPKVVDRSILQRISTQKRQFIVPSPSDPFSIPIEFALAAFRFGHSMVRPAYSWNKWFILREAHSLLMLSGTHGQLNDIPSGDDPSIAPVRALPTVWASDFTRWFEFGRSMPGPPRGEFNYAKRIDTLIEDPLARLPPQALPDGETTPFPPERTANLAFRTLQRGSSAGLAFGQSVARLMSASCTALTSDQILTGNRGADLHSSRLLPAELNEFCAHTPLWFYILREAEYQDGVLNGVGGTLVAEVLHAAIDRSQYSFFRGNWQPTYGRNGEFGMSDLMLHAYGDPLGLNPLEQSH